METKQLDIINKASHYNVGKFEVIDVIEEFNLGFNIGNALKYIARAGKKDRLKTVEDLKKARYYIERELSLVEKHGIWRNAQLKVTEEDRVTDISHDWKLSVRLECVIHAILFSTMVRGRGHVLTKDITKHFKDALIYLNDEIRELEERGGVYDIN